MMANPQSEEHKKRVVKELLGKFSIEEYTATEGTRFGPWQFGRLEVERDTHEVHVRDEDGVEITSMLMYDLPDRDENDVEFVYEWLSTLDGRR